MQVSVETTSALERRMEVSVRASASSRRSTALEARRRTVKLKGFRPGKVRPSREAAVRRAGATGGAVRPDAVELRRSRHPGKAEPPGPRIERSRSGRTRTSVPRDFEIFPQIDLQASRYRRDAPGGRSHRGRRRRDGAEPPRAAAEVRSRRARMPYGDRVTMDFEGLIDGAAFEGSKGEDVAVLLGGGRMLKAFEAGITGLKAGERKSIDVPYPADYTTRHWPEKSRPRRARQEVDEKRCRPRRGVLPRVRRDRGRHPQLRSEVTDNMRRELAETSAPGSSSNCSTVAGCEPDRGAEEPGRRAGARVQIEAARRIGAKDASQVPPPEPSSRRPAGGWPRPAGRRADPRAAA